MEDNPVRNILVVEDDENILQYLTQYLSHLDYTVVQARNNKEAIDSANRNKIDIAIIDKNLPNGNGLEIVEKFSTEFMISSILITAERGAQIELEAIRRGAAEVIFKPMELDDLKVALEKIKFNIILKKEVKTLSSLSDIEHAFNGIIGTTPYIRTIFKDIAELAKTKVTVLITGETGTGKELFARLIHDSSNVDKEKFLAINCSSIPRELLESELFGYEKGAFTGAVNAKSGLFELSQNGTLFLDEIGDMPYDLQAKLLRVLEEKKIRRLGSTKSVDIDFRLIAATNQDLNGLVAKKTFRKDLFYRLNVFHIDLPPLRERRPDIIPLSYYFMQKYAVQYSKNVPEISEKASLKLMSYDYPGNIRELEHIIEKAVIVCSNNVIQEGNILLPPRRAEVLEEERPGNLSVNIEQPLKKVIDYWKEEIIKEYFMNLLNKYGWDVPKIIEISGIERSYFYKIVKKYRLTEQYSTKLKKSQHTKSERSP